LDDIKVLPRRLLAAPHFILTAGVERLAMPAFSSPDFHRACVPRTSSRATELFISVERQD